MLAIYEGQADASGFYERSKQVWTNLAQLIEQLETKFQRQAYLVGDQVSLAESVPALSRRGRGCPKILSRTDPYIPQLARRRVLCSNFRCRRSQVCLRRVECYLATQWTAAQWRDRRPEAHSLPGKPVCPSVVCRNLQGRFALSGRAPRGDGNAWNLPILRSRTISPSLGS